MPLYEFSCPSCGAFEQVRPMAQAGDPLGCPRCGAPAQRRFSAPGGRQMAAALSAAHERNERSAHEPARASRAEVDAAKARGRPLHAHHHGPQRPWQIGH
jgi:putative FmdB family regulatory protein